MSWVTPKTNWGLLNPDGSRQYFNADPDYNRITENLNCIWNFAKSAYYKLSELYDMPSLDFSSIPTKDIFNAVERNLDILANDVCKPDDYIAGRVFNGDGKDKSWDYNDLNRIEGSLNKIYTILKLEYSAAPFSNQIDFYCNSLIL